MLGVVVVDNRKAAGQLDEISLDCSGAYMVTG